MKSVTRFLIVFFIAGWFLFPIEAASYPIGLLSHWQFDDRSGSTAADSLGDKGGTIDGASWDNVLVDGALRFDGIDDIVRFPNISGYGEFTMSAWFKASSLDNLVTIFQTGMRYFGLRQDEGIVYLTHEDRQGGGGRQYDYYMKKNDYRDFWEKWHFFVMTAAADDSELKVYLDGEFIGEVTFQFTGWNSVLSFTNIGAIKASLLPGNHEGYHFSGVIDEVAMFDRALPAEEVILYYQTGLNGLDLSTPIPEPSTLLLVASALVGLVAMRRKMISKLRFNFFRLCCYPDGGGVLSKSSFAKRQRLT